MFIFSGLAMTLNIQQNEYVSGAGDTAGARITILPQNQMPFPEDHGFTLSPGLETYIHITKVINVYSYHRHFINS